MREVPIGEVPAAFLQLAAFVVNAPPPIRRGRDKATRAAAAFEMAPSTILPQGDATDAVFFSKNLNEGAIERLATELATNKTIKKLDLDYNKCGVAGAKCLAAALETNTTLEKLYMEGNDIGPQGAAYLAAALEKNETLNTMNLGHNGIGPTGAASLAASIHASNGSLQFLNLSFNHLGKRGVPHLKVIEAKLAVNTEVHWSKSGADLSSGQYKSSALQESIDKFTQVVLA